MIENEWLNGLDIIDIKKSKTKADDDEQIVKKKVKKRKPKKKNKNNEKETPNVRAEDNSDVEKITQSLQDKKLNYLKQFEIELKKLQPTLQTEKNVVNKEKLERTLPKSYLPPPAYFNPPTFKEFMEKKLEDQEKAFTTVHSVSDNDVDTKKLEYEKEQKKVGFNNNTILTKTFDEDVDTKCLQEFKYSRYDTYETENEMVITIFEKNLKNDQFKVYFEEDKAMVLFIDDTLKRLPLSFTLEGVKINPETSFSNSSNSSLRINLKKTVSKKGTKTILKLDNYSFKKFKSVLLNDNFKDHFVKFDKLFLDTFLSDNDNHLQQVENSLVKNSIQDLEELEFQKVKKNFGLI
ncbi:hypothetical protein HK099_003609 [Clydaea vesicula]|uniref:Uncharacterized protein n=1 Tax=Clydaea vesicula TaxID=447962 RepID=A0AAD5U607_9FUNG|nr:hypothetical protein HK099_003609 [Clydaea vesicula]